MERGLGPLHGLDFSDAVDYHYGRFPPSGLDYERLIEPLAASASALARFDQMLKTLHNSEILLAPLRNQEAVLSSRMEGTISTMDEVLQYEADYGDHEGAIDKDPKFRSDVVETWMYQRALRRAQQAMEQGQPVSAWLLRATHRELLSFGRGAEKSPGEFKTEQNYLVDRNRRKVLFVPVKPEFLADGLEKLFAYIDHGAGQFLVKTAVAHVEFEALHPFKDGNGRIGRMLITLMLWRAGVISAPHFYVSGYLEEEKDRYIDTMRAVSARGDWTGWVMFFLEALEKQAIRNLEIAEEIKKLYEDMKVVFRDVLHSKWHTAALDFVFEKPVFRNSTFTRALPLQTAMKFTKIMQEKGLLKELEPASGRRAALYAFEPLLRIVRV